MTPYYEQSGITIYHGDCRDVLAWREADALVTDPPFGIDYLSGRAGSLPRGIVGDSDTGARDDVLALWGTARAALVFGSWKQPRPARTRMVLVWDTRGALGMGALDLPWKPAHQEIYVLGHGFAGRRTTDVLSFAPVQSMASNGRQHPHEKPVNLLLALIVKCPGIVIADPFCGVGSTLIAAKQLSRRAIGIETEERYCEIAAKRLSQEVLPLGTTA